MIKISFTGDIMCYAEQISAIEEKGKDYNTILKNTIYYGYLYYQ